MDPSRFARLKECVLTAAALPEGERAAWLARACVGDETLRTEAEVLLAQRGHTAGAVKTGALDAAMVDVLARALPAAGAAGAGAVALRMPERIGPYRIAGVLGEGGMGTVYRAQQETPVRREVALKVVRAGFDSAGVLARFESERQALALMDHPGIARLLDAGATEDGRPFFAMEMVLGVPITVYARLQRLDRAARLRLVLEVCHAVRHAHRRGVIHRDIKPSNVLVTLVNEQPVAKVIDFSIAKVLDEPAAGTDRRTRTGQIVGTIEYMSPEQARGDVHAVDARSDVYALGVLLYEMLADRLPYDLSDRPLHEAVKVIVEEPPRPMRGHTMPTTGRVDPDIETIARKCLEKDPARRYGSAAGLAEDLERHLSGQPILARPPSRAYQARKFIARHRVGVAAVTAVMAALVAGIIGTGAGLVHANRARAEAEDEARTSREVTRFLTGLFEVADPSEARGNSVPARELLDKGAAEIREKLKDQPRVQARLMHTIGDTYSNLGLREPALALLQEALEAQRGLLGPDHPDTLATLESVGWTLYTAGRLEEAEKTLREAVERSRRVLGPEAPDTLERMNHLAVTLWRRGKLDEAGALYAEGLVIERRVLGEEHMLTLKTMNNLGILYGAQGRFEDALPLFEKTLEARRRLYGDTHPLIVTAARNLAITYENFGRLEEALALKREAAEVAGRLYGDDNPKTLTARASMASTLSMLGRAEESEPMLVSILAAQRRSIGEDHPETLETRHFIAEAQARAGRLDEAIRSWTEVLEAYRRVYGPDHNEAQTISMHLAANEGRRGRLDAAARHLRGVLEIRTRVGGPEAPATLDTAAALGCVEARSGDRETGLARLRQTVAAGGTPRPLVSNGPLCGPLREDPEFAPLLGPAAPAAS